MWLLFTTLRINQNKNQNTNNFNEKLEQLIRKCKNKSSLALIARDMNASFGKRHEESCTGRYSNVLRNRNEDYLVNICQTNNFKIHFLHTFLSNTFFSHKESHLATLQQTRIDQHLKKTQLFWKNDKFHNCKRATL